MDEFVKAFAQGVEENDWESVNLVCASILDVGELYPGDDVKTIAHIIVSILRRIEKLEGKTE